MPPVGSFIVVHMINKQPIGEVFRRKPNNWPLHITIAPWFEIADASEMNDVLLKTALLFSRFKVKIGSKDLFGIQKDVPVNVIEDQTTIKILHEKVMDAVRSLGAKFQGENWIGDNYHAHVTRHEDAGQWNKEGDEVVIDDFHLVRLLPEDMCEVFACFTLKVEM